MRILLVEDEPTLATQIQTALERAGYVVQHAAEGNEAWYQGAEQVHDAAILDLGLPGLDGLSVLRKWRSAGVSLPVLILTARSDWHEKVAGIDAGADDYLSKPFHMEELLARLRALLRRAAGQVSAQLLVGELSLDTVSSQVTYAGTELSLTSHEYRLLAFMMHHPGKVFSRSDLTEHLYAQDFERDSNTIEVFIGRLRKKLPAHYIETVRGLGYKLIAPDS